MKELAVLGSGEALLHAVNSVKYWSHDVME
jgi:hypothetical protein